MQISNKSHNKPLWLFPLKLNWERKLATFYLGVHKPPNSFSFCLKPHLSFTRWILQYIFKQHFSFCLSSAIKKVSGNLLYNKTAFDLACGIYAIQSSVTLAAWRYPWRYCNASAFRLVLSIDGTLKHTIEQKCQCVYTLNYCYILLITVSTYGTKSNNILRAAAFHCESSCWNYNPWCRQFYVLLIWIKYERRVEKTFGY